MKNINPFLWFDNNAEEAVGFYTSIFKDSKVKTTTRYNESSANAAGMLKDSVMTISFDLAGQPFVVINGGPVFKFNPSISFIVNCRTEDEVQELWDKLSVGGLVRMPLDKYPFSEKYGWIEDKYGVSWQLIKATGDFKQTIIPSLLFVGNKSGKAEEAINLYTSVFSSVSKNSSNVLSTYRYTADQKPEKEGTIMFADFKLDGQIFAAMDSAREHNFSFNEAISFVINCDNQKELDHFWDKLSEGGDPKAQMCGWLKDRYGLSWQIVPAALGDLLSSNEPGKSERVMQKVLQMKKLDIESLEKA
jgi:predicted 3-demethylubiquinone-9 3-methyltransferase (glyoxalase superfamily)